MAIWLLMAVTLAVYANHFHNSFHFDDFHTVSDNPHIRTLKNIPRFFTDSSTFSVLLTHQVYRPIVTASLALDYRLGGGLNPVAFHASTFFWFLLQLLLLYALYVRLFDGSEWTALLAAAAYGLHPVCAETVNYVIQRGDLYSTLGVIASLVLYIRKPSWRRFGLYLIPYVLACLSKPPALVYPLLLFLYIWLYEEPHVRRALKATLPTLAVTAALALLLSRMTAATFSSGGGPREAYWITQTWVTGKYFLAFFWPARLSADYDIVPFPGFPPEAAAGCLFLATLLAAILWTARRPATRTIGFGLAWFLITLLPTALTPLAEAANDHRMYFAFVGLVPAVFQSARLLVNRLDAPFRRASIAAACLALVAASAATWSRNEVWRSEESLWLDVTRKSPHNGRGWMNYGLTQMSKGDYAKALACFEQAQVYNPAYSLLEINTAIAHGALQHNAEAEAHFRRALALAPNQPAPHFYYGRWLLGLRRHTEAVAELEKAYAINPADLPCLHVLMQAHFEQQNWSALRPLAAKALELDASDAIARNYQAKLAGLDQDLAKSQSAVPQTPEGYLDLSLQYYRAGRFEDCVTAARHALQLRKDYSGAYNNIAACNNALGRWDEGIAAAREAVRLHPASQLARNNLAWAVSRKGKSQK
ncbi:MAG: tetratricopeptide repeat protein [Bryobacterales bacterium]|nr:tetratricopeptide repeat protein [Bryobacterales bacterium]